MSHIHKINQIESANGKPCAVICLCCHKRAVVSACIQCGKSFLRPIDKRAKFLGRYSPYCQTECGREWRKANAS